MFKRRNQSVQRFFLTVKSVILILQKRSISRAISRMITDTAIPELTMWSGSLLP